MYNKLFQKILDSSIWLESEGTRLVWLTLIAAMDEDGVAVFASVPNLAHRARVSIEAAQAAVDCLESPDPHSSDPDNDGRRLERIPGGWLVLNAAKYRAIVTRAEGRRKTRDRVRRHRAKKSAPVTIGNDPETQSAAAAETEAEATADMHGAGDSEPMAAGGAGDRTDEFVRAAQWIREQLPALEMDAMELVGMVRAKAGKLDGPTALKKAIETAVERALRGKNPAGLFRSIMGARSRGGA